MALTLISCRQDSASLVSPPPAQKQEPVTAAPVKESAPAVFERDDAVWIRLPTRQEQRLTDRGMGVNISIAPNEQWIAIDKAILSNLQVTTLFQRQPDGTYLEMSTRNPSTLAWEQWSALRGIQSDDVTSPRTRTISWSKDNHHIVIELTGVDPDGEFIEHTLEIELIEQ